MRYQLENEVLKVEIESFGAELKSIVKKQDNQEYMWEADPAFWGKTSPILFPFIGKLEGAKYNYNGTDYDMDKHGFARDMDFNVIKQETDNITFAIESNENTMKKFPFTFVLEVEYVLEADSVIENIRVINKGGEVMYFSFGGHPAFACPLVKGNKRTSCFVKLYGAENKEKVYSTQIGVPDGLLTGVKTEIALENGVFAITDDIFDNDALCFAEEGITAVSLLDENKNEYIRMDTDCLVWGIWSMPDSNAGYVCIEPWWGICDSKGYAGDVQSRPYTNQVNAGETWSCGYKMTVS